MQKAFIKWLFYAHREVREVSWAIPNGGTRDIREAVSLKQEGVTAGAPDVHINVPRGIFHGLLIEFKVSPNKPSLVQVKMMANLTKQGYKCAVCYTLDSAIELVDSYLKEEASVQP